jgi:hypothetical protein
MTPEKLLGNSPRAAAPTAGELMSDFRARIAQQDSEMAERRRLEVAELVSDRHTLEERIRIWERLYGLPLPQGPDHPLVSIIAASTHLTVEQVVAEQRRRWPDAKRATRTGASWNTVLPR